MKSTSISAPSDTPPAGGVRRDRRGLVVGAGVAGVAAVAAQALVRGGVPVPAAGAAGAVVPDGEGYRLTPHVQRYYDTTKA